MGKRKRNASTSRCDEKLTKIGNVCTYEGGHPVTQPDSNIVNLGNVARRRPTASKCPVSTGAEPFLNGISDITQEDENNHGSALSYTLQMPSHMSDSERENQTLTATDCVDECGLLPLVGNVTINKPAFSSDNIIRGTTNGSVFGNSGFQLRTSARVSKKLKRDGSPPSVDKKCFVSVEENIKEDPSKNGKTPDGKRRRRAWELWSQEDKNTFFEALNEYGKDFDAIQNYFASKVKKKSLPAHMIKNKDQVRHFYYRTWHKISKHLDISDDVKKSTQELYGLVNYGELRKKVGSVLDEKNGLRLNELVYKGTTTVRWKGKSLRVKTPLCRALKKLNQVEDHKIEEQVRLPSQVTVELRPHHNQAWTTVQSTAQNPRVRVTLSLQRRLSTLIQYLERKWRSHHLKYKDKLLSTVHTVTNTSPSSDMARLHVMPRDSANIRLLSVNIGETVTSASVSLRNYEEKMLKAGNLLHRSRLDIGKNGNKKKRKRKTEGERKSDSDKEGENKVDEKEDEGKCDDVNKDNFDFIEGNASQDDTDLEECCDEVLYNVSKQRECGVSENDDRVSEKGGDESEDNGYHSQKIVTDGAEEVEVVESDTKEDISIKVEDSSEVPPLHEVTLRQLRALETAANPELLNSDDVVFVREATALSQSSSARARHMSQDSSSDAAVEDKTNVPDFLPQEGSTASSQIEPCRKIFSSLQVNVNTDRLLYLEDEHIDEDHSPEVCHVDQEAPSPIEALPELIADNDEEEVDNIRKGFTAETTRMLTIGELYIMLGSEGKIQLEYEWRPSGTGITCESKEYEKSTDQESSAGEKSADPKITESEQASTEQQTAETDNASLIPAQKEDTAKEHVKDAEKETTNREIQNLTCMLQKLISMAKNTFKKPKTSPPAPTCRCGHICMNSPPASKQVLASSRSPATSKSPATSRVGRSAARNIAVKQQQGTVSTTIVTPAVPATVPVTGTLGNKAASCLQSADGDGLPLPSTQSTQFPTQPVTVTSAAITMAATTSTMVTGRDSGVFRRPLLMPVHAKSSHNPSQAFREQLDKFMPKYCNRRGRTGRKNVVVQRVLPLLPKSTRRPAMMTLKVMPQPAQLSGSFMPITSTLPVPAPVLSIQSPSQQKTVGSVLTPNRNLPVSQTSLHGTQHVGPLQVSVNGKTLLINQPVINASVTPGDQTDNNKNNMQPNLADLAKSDSVQSLESSNIVTTISNSVAAGTSLSDTVPSSLPELSGNNTAKISVLETSGCNSPSSASAPAVDNVNLSAFSAVITSSASSVPPSTVITSSVSVTVHPSIPAVISTSIQDSVPELHIPETSTASFSSSPPPNISALLDISLSGVESIPTDGMVLNDSNEKLLDIELGNSNSSFSSLLTTEFNKVTSAQEASVLQTPPRPQECSLGNTTPPSSPTRMLKFASDTHWLNGEVGDFSLSSLLGHLESPLKPQASVSISGLDDTRLATDVDSQLHCLMSENSVDYTAKFADLAAQIVAAEHANKKHAEN